MNTRILTVMALPLLAGCGVAYGAYGGGHYDRGVYRDDGAYGRAPYEYEYARRMDFRRLPVPRGHLPSPGRCRVWLPGVSPGHQPRQGSCRALERRVPRGGWLLVRSRVNPGIVELFAFDSHRPRVRIRYAYDVRTGRRINY